MTTATRTAAPAYIARDAYAGHWQTVKTPGTVTLGVGTARELGTQANADGILIIWEYCGTVNGRWLFTRTRFVAAEDGRLHGYTSDGSKIIVHPADRDVRYLGRRA